MHRCSLQAQSPRHPLSELIQHRCIITACNNLIQLSKNATVDGPDLPEKPEPLACTTVCRLCEKWHRQGGLSNCSCFLADPFDSASGEGPLPCLQIATCLLCPCMAFLQGVCEETQLPPCKGTNPFGPEPFLHVSI